MINARTDGYLFAVGAPESRLEETLRRAKTYRVAGADCVFVPGVVDGRPSPGCATIPWYI